MQSKTNAVTKIMKMLYLPNYNTRFSVIFTQGKEVIIFMNEAKCVKTNMIGWLVGNGCMTTAVHLKTCISMK
jgi:hypothetical protein